MTKRKRYAAVRHDPYKTDRALTRDMKSHWGPKNKNIKRRMIIEVDVWRSGLSNSPSSAGFVAEACVRGRGYKLPGGASADTVKRCGRTKHRMGTPSRAIQLAVKQLANKLK